MTALTEVPTCRPTARTTTVGLDELCARQQPGWSLERAFYTDPTVFDHDLERVWHRQWIFAGHGNAITKAGDFFLVQIGDESLILTRDAKGAVHALFNSCRHRGSRVCNEPSGNARSLVCPYHQWVYGQDGRLISARLMGVDFDKSRFGLRRAHAREVQGLIFICLAPEPPDFTQFTKLVEPRLTQLALPSAKVAHVADYEVQSNWKLVVENSRECYHCGTGHPQYCNAVGFAASIGSREEAEADQEINAAGRALLTRHGIDASPVPFAVGGWFQFRRFFLREGMVTESMDGKPVAPLMGSVPAYETGMLVVVGLPNLLLEVSPDYAMTLAMFPVSPTATRARVTWLVRGDAREGLDYEVPRLTEFWRLTSEQDWKLCEDNQAGINSRYYEPGPYAPDERGVEHFVRWYLEQLV